MVTVKFRQLIDLAIGTPEPGHVNFYALHCLLNCIAEKLQIIDEKVDYAKYANLLVKKHTTKTRVKLARFPVGSKRLIGGADYPEENTTELQEEYEEKIEDTKEEYDLEEAENADIEEQQLEINEIDETTFQQEDIINKERAEESNMKNIESDTKTMEPDMNIMEFNPLDITEPDIATLKDGVSSGEISLHTDLISKYDLPTGKSEIVLTAETPNLTIKLLQHFKNMKEQLELAIEQLLLLTFLTITKTPQPELFNKLYLLSKKLRVIRRENNLLFNGEDKHVETSPSLDWSQRFILLNEEMEDEPPEPRSSSSKLEEIDSPDRKLTEGHLCYTNERIMDQLLDLKGEFCMMMNKINEVSAKVLEQESQQTFRFIKELQDQMKDTRITLNKLKDQQDGVQNHIHNNTVSIDYMNKTIEDLRENKLDKSEIEVMLSDKVDYTQLQRKVSLDQLLELQCRIDKKFAEILRQINDNDKKTNLLIEHLRESLGFAALEGLLNEFKVEVEKKIQSLQNTLQKYIDSTNDECAAAGARVKVLQDLACLSCDTNCVMRTMEKAKVGKLPNAHASLLYSPLITYELSSIRKSGIMGYYRKDDFPHTPNAWMNRQEGNVSMEQCVSRHAGGTHTIATPKDRVEKLFLKKK